MEASGGEEGGWEEEDGEVMLGSRRISLVGVSSVGSRAADKEREVGVREGHFCCFVPDLRLS